MPFTKLWDDGIYKFFLFVFPAILSCCDTLCRHISPQSLSQKVVPWQFKMQKAKSGIFSLDSGQITTAECMSWRVLHLAYSPYNYKLVIQVICNFLDMSISSTCSIASCSWLVSWFMLDFAYPLFLAENCRGGPDSKFYWRYKIFKRGKERGIFFFAYPSKKNMGGVYSLVIVFL